MGSRDPQTNCSSQLCRREGRGVILTDGRCSSCGSGEQPLGAAACCSGGGGSNAVDKAPLGRRFQLQTALASFCRGEVTGHRQLAQMPWPRERSTPLNCPSGGRCFDRDLKRDEGMRPPKARSGAKGMRRRGHCQPGGREGSTDPTPPRSDHQGASRTTCAVGCPPRTLGPASQKDTQMLPRSLGE